MRISIVIPTITIGLIAKCLNSIIEYTNLKDIEIIVVSNGIRKEDKFKLETYPIKIVWFDNPIGAVPALNEGIKEATGDFVILLNDDCQILNSPKNQWLDMLLTPFDVNPKLAITSPLRHHSQFGPELSFFCKEDVDYGFLVFFCAAISRKAITDIGLLDEELKCGVDVDYCFRARRRGFEILQIPEMIGAFPIWHQGEGTVHSYYGLEKWNSILEEDVKTLKRKYS